MPNTLRLAATLLICVCSSGLGQELPGRLHQEGIVSVTCFTMPYRELALASEAGGVLMEVLVKEGDSVHKGQPLVRLKADVLKAQLEISKSRVISAQHTIDASEVEYETRKREYDRMEKLLKGKGGVVSQEEYDQAKRDMLVAQIGLAGAKAAKREAELTVARDQASLDETQINAPFDGLVHRILKREGEAVERERDVLMSLASIDPLYVIAYVPISTIGYIKQGDKARLVLEHMPKTAMVCQVDVVDKVADAASGTYRVRLVLPNPGKKLPAGAKGQITFKLPKRHRP